MTLLLLIGAALLVFLSGAAAAQAQLKPDGIELVLAATWQPGFCASEAGRDKPECRSLTADRFDATHFALHGLWPDDLDDTQIFPCYCDSGGPMDCRERRPPDVRTFVSDEVFEELRIVMPGVRSGLHRHEWTKHGSCYEDDKTGDDRDADPDEYFTEAMWVLEKLNASPARTLFADHIGEVLTRDEIEAAFDEAFGDGAGERIIVVCSRTGSDRVITELRINLKGDIAPDSDLGNLILNAPSTAVSTGARSCSGGDVASAAAN
jgi:ribonuclease T2